VDELVNDKTFAIEPAKEGGAEITFGGNGRRMTTQDKVQMALSSIQELRGMLGQIQVPEGETKVTVNVMQQEQQATSMTETQVIRRDPDTGIIIGAEATQYYEQQTKTGMKTTKVIEHRTVKRDPITHRITGVNAVRQYEDNK
jgi:hypothetical protein